MPTVFLALGSNLGNREGILRFARQAVAELPDTTLLGSSSLYETAPVGGPAGQPAFLNAVLQIETALSPEVLLRAAQDMEAAMGRERKEHWGPRTLDVDILCYDERVTTDSCLLLPHPRLAERRFVLVPLCDLAPGWRHPLLGLSCQELLNACSDNGQVSLFKKEW